MSTRFILINLHMTIFKSLSMKKRVTFLIFQFLLCKLFQQYVIQENENNLIDLDCIEKLGGIHNVIANNLEAYHLKLQPKEQNELSLFFKVLNKPHHSSTGANYEKIGSISETYES